MPLYDYKCANGHTFEAKHGFDDPTPACPTCGEAQVQRVITRAATMLQGVNASAGRGGTASKEQLQNKWAEEGPKLREKLVSKLGEDTVSKYAPTLGNNND